MSTKLTYTGAEVQELLDKIEKGDFDNAKTLEGHPASYFAIASEFTSLAESFTTEQGRINTLYRYFNNGSANNALRLGGQLPSYYATTTQYEILQQALSDFKSLFDSMFEKDSDGNIHAKLALWSSGGITAGGVGSGSSGGGGGISYNRLDSWADYSADKSGWVLSALLGNDLNTRLSSIENAGYITTSALAPYALRSEIPSLVGYATQGWVGENYLSKYGGTVNGSITATSFIGNLTGTADKSKVLGDYYGERVTSANLDFTDSAVRKIIASSSMTTAKPPADGSILHFAWDNTGGWNHQLYICSNGTIEPNKRMAWRAQNYGSWGEWKSIAFADSNVASATKLATARNIFGHGFNGTQNILGGEKSIEINSINAISDAPNNWIENYSLKMESANNAMTFMVDKTENGRKAMIQVGHNNPIYANFLGALCLNPLGGNVAIGGKTADEKLHVHGNGKFTGALTANSLTIGSATLTYDSVNNALCINGNMYALGGVTAGGAGISTYSSLEARVARLEQQLNIS